MAAKRWDTHEVAAERRRVFGRDFVPSREDAEREARRIIDTRIGHMNAEEIVQLGRVFNRHGKTGQIRQDRFSPGFAGAVMAKLAQNTERFNEVVSRLWRGTPGRRGVSAWPDVRRSLHPAWCRLLAAQLPALPS